MEKRNLDKLASGIKTLQRTIAKLGHDDPMPELLRLSHKPGRAEFEIGRASCRERVFRTV